MADAANSSRLENMVVLLRIDSSESSKLAFYPCAPEQFRAHDQRCLAFDIFLLNSNLFF